MDIRNGYTAWASSGYYDTLVYLQIRTVRSWLPDAKKTHGTKSYTLNEISVSQ